MSGIIIFLLDWLIPWILGTVVSLACLKRRYGYWSLAIGSGYLLGLLITLLTQKYVTSVGLFGVLLSEAGLAAVIAFFFRAKRCTIEEQRLEEAPPNWAYLVSLVLVLLLVARFLIMYWYLGSVSPEVLSSNFQPITLPLWKMTSWGVSLSDWSMLNQHYGNHLLGSNSVWMYLPWLAVGVALGFIVFGGLRYVGCRLLPATLGTYMVLSLPFMMGVGALANLLSIAVIAYYFWLLILLAVLIGFSEKRLVLLVVAAVLVVSAYQYWLLFALITMIAYVIGRYVNMFVALASTVVLIIVGFILVGADVHHIITLLKQATLVEYRWHFAILSALISFVFFIFYRYRRDVSALELVFIGGVVVLFAMLGWLLFGQHSGDSHDVVAMMAYFTPLLCLIPVTVYQLTTQDQDSLPVI